MSHVLHAYLVTVREKGSKQPALLGNFDGKGADLLKEFTAFFKDPKMKDWKDDDGDAAARVDTVHPVQAAQPNVLAVTIKAGETGLASEFVETTATGLGTTTKFVRGPQHAELVPSLLLAKLPGTRKAGFLVVHSPSGRGVKTKFWERFHEWFQKRHIDYVVELNRASPEGFYKKLIKEENLKRVTLIRYLKPADMVDEDARWFDKDTIGKITTTVQQAGRLGYLRKQDLNKALKGGGDGDGDGADLSSLLVFHGEQYDEIRTTFRDSKGREHSIVLGENRAPRAGYDVTEQVSYDKAGRPTYASLRAAALTYIGLLVP